MNWLDGLIEKVRVACGEGSDPFPYPMVRIPAGTFTMGARDEGGRILGDRGDERPLHEVSVKKFELGKYPVTQAQWLAVMGSNPSHFNDGGEHCPVEQVRWNDVQEFIRRLNALTGKAYRLPTEAEWEYAARTGNDDTFGRSGSGDLNQVAWHSGNSRRMTHPVGQKQPNGWGLHDMLGNVWEWVEDTYAYDYSAAPTDGSAQVFEREVSRVLRGGSWISDFRSVCVSSRFGFSEDRMEWYTGFRLARSLP